MTSTQRWSVLALVLLAAVGVGVGIGATIWSGKHSAAGRIAAAPARRHVNTPTRATEATADLYSIEAASGWVTKVADNRWVLSLRQPRVTWFADRPARASGTTTPSRLAAAWPRLFFGSAPNGSIVAPDASDGERPTALVINKPHAQPGLMSFDISTDQGTSDAARTWMSSLTKARSAQNGGIAFFIDDSSDTQNAETEPSTFPYGKDWGLVWRADLSQCAGYGTVTPRYPYPPGDHPIAEYVDVTYETNSSGSCFFKKTYARFDITSQGTKIGGITFDGSGDFLSCSGVGCYETDTQSVAIDLP